MSLYDAVKNDIQRITSNPSGFGKVIVFNAPTGEIATINGLHTKHHLGIDTEGNRVNTKNAHISVSEQLLIDAGYPARVNGKVFLRGHKISVEDSTGTLCTYVIREWYPNETMGLITCILGDYE